jgi:predicted DNA-binding protein
MAAVEDHVLSVRLNPDLYELLRQFAFDQRKPQADVIREALRNHLMGEKDTPK